MDDKEFLQWIYNRLVKVHGEDPHYDYMHRLRAVADVQDSPRGVFEEFGGSVSDKSEPMSIKSAIVVEVPEHEVLLSFANDSGAEKFIDWWHCAGEASFNEYCEEISE